MCRLVSIACRLQNKTQHLCWQNYVDSVSDRFNYEGHFSFLYKSSLNRFQFTLHLRCKCIDGLAIQAWNTFHKDSCPRQSVWEILLHSFYMSLLVHHIKVYAWYSSFNYCLSIWVINPNWTSEHNYLCSSASI